MRKLFPLLLLICFTAQAQVRTYSDNASGTFVFGLDSYFYGESGTLDFSVGGVSVKAFLADGTVRTGDSLLESGSGDTLIGIHDFTGDKAPELMVARRSGNSVSAQIYTYASGTWSPIGRMEAGGKEIRVFRQVVSIRSGEVLHSWTWHTDRFDYKRSN
ncbi:MAG: hypothetical protein II454_02645 [Bacteroidales bacterium]|jgi:hypothetical protein|nr:hypothetical protein [Bacteroidales bacterium]